MAKILIVDDSSGARKRLWEMITGLGHVVVGDADNGVQAFVEYTRLRPDIVTMDLTMQGLSGAEATSKIISVHPDARVIVISAMEVRQGIIDALERGARHFIIKPIRQDQLASAINNVLQHPFDRQKHQEYVRKLKGAEGIQTAGGGYRNPIVPPYEINTQDKRLIHVLIHPPITTTSARSLFLELQEHMQINSRILLDFGTITTLSPQLLSLFNMLIVIIQKRNAMVQALSQDKSFMAEVAAARFDNGQNLLANAMKYIGC